MLHVDATVTGPVVHANFAEDLRLWLHETMTRLGWELPDKDVFEAAGVKNELQRLSIAYVSGMLRRIKPAPRRVEWSTDLRAKMAALSEDAVLGVQTIVEESLAGEDLNVRLSTRINAPADPDKLDMLLADWGIYHLHLGRRVPGRPFAKRGDLLLFLRVDADALYLIDVLPHGVWEEDCLMLIVWRNWRHLLTPTLIPGGVPPTPAERKQARAAGVQELWQGPDRVNYFPYLGGYSTARFSTQAVHESDRLRDRVRQVERICRAEAGDIARKVGHAAGRTLGELHLSLRIDPDGTGNPFRHLVEETTTKVLFHAT